MQIRRKSSYLRNSIISVKKGIRIKYAISYIYKENEFVE